MSAKPPELFRAEAVESHAAGLGREGSVLRFHPRWISWSYWLVVAFLVALVLFALLVRITEYARGPAIIRAEGRAMLTSTSEGRVIEIRAVPGRRVERGSMLVQLENAQELAACARIDREIELQTRKILMDLTDETARRALTRLQAERELATAALEAKVTRAPFSGTVSDIRIREGQYLLRGQAVLSLRGSTAGFSVVALLPGDARPLLHTGDEMRLELVGYPYAYQQLTIHSIDDEVVGSEEARRFLGPVLSDTVAVSGPVILVRAKLPSTAFRSQKQLYDYFDGMIGFAEVPIRTENVVVSLFPGLRALLQTTHE